MTDESFCSAPDRHEADVLSLSFDVEVVDDDYDQQIGVDLLRPRAGLGCESSSRTEADPRSRDSLTEPATSESRFCASNENKTVVIVR
jgi:hypothetical protein